MSPNQVLPRIAHLTRYHATARQRVHDIRAVVAEDILVAVLTRVVGITAASRSEQTPHLTFLETAFGLNRLDRRAAVSAVLTFVQDDSIGIRLSKSLTKVEAEAKATCCF